MPGETVKILRFAKLTKQAYAPVKATPHAAGFDLRSAYDYEIPAHGYKLVKTDLQIALPENTYGRIAPRSGLALNFHIGVGGGVVDADYRGNVGVILFNHSPTETFRVSQGDRIAQLICEVICHPQLQELEQLDETGRGQKGFGSTGIN